ncbi:MAG: NAD(P)/FAD-dependent oxidoreductase [Candidatus Buchananbacteria bacterium]
MNYDLIVIGGGPAGLMAAGRAGELGARVLLLEKNNQPGLKLLLTGNQRCNLTNAVNVRALVKAFGNNGKFLFSALTKFDSSDTIKFFTSRGVPLKTETANRVFPVSNKANDVLRVMLDYLRKSSVKVITRATVKKIIKQKNLITKIVLTDGQEFSANNYLIATGGLAYPITGSTGDGYTWLAKLGHTITKTYPALTPIIVKDKIVKQLEGTSLTEVNFTWLKNNKVIASQHGEAIFTAQGLSGPAIFDASGEVARALPHVALNLDFLPQETSASLDLRLRTIFSENKNKQIKNVLANLLTPKLVLTLLTKAQIKPETEVNQITKTNRQTLSHLIKNFSLEVTKVEDYTKAMLTTGGVALNEVDPKTLRSKIIPNLLLAGEILDLAGPTGGFNLQACWSTGHLAGENALTITNQN